jgi:hypothetical protein
MVLTAPSCRGGSEVVIVNPSGSDTNGKASIREVYAIVSDLEEKIVSEIRESEHRIMEAVGDVRKLRASDMERVIALEEWRRSVEESKRVSIAVKDGRLWMFKELGQQMEDHWRSISLVVLFVIALLDFFFQHVQVNP